MKKILALCGYPTAGKDEIAKYLVSYYGFTRVAFADPVREAVLALDPIIPIVECGELFYLRLSDEISMSDWTEAKKVPEVRRLLQVMGTEVGREIIGKDTWVNLAKQKIESAPGHVVITDTRFLDEVAMLRKKDAFILEVQRPGVGPVNDHKSEKLDYSEISDGAVINNGTVDDLHYLLDFLMDDLGCCLQSC